MNGIVPPSPNVRRRAAERGGRGLVERGFSHGASAGAVPAGRRTRPPKRTTAPDGGSLRERALDRRRGLARVARRREAEAQRQRASTGAARCRPIWRREARRRRCSSPSAATCGPAAARRCRRHRPCPAGERELVGGGVAERLAPSPSPAAMRSGGISTCSSGSRISPVALVLEPVEQLADDAEARRHDAAGLAGVDAFGEHLDGAACR